MILLCVLPLQTKPQFFFTCLVAAAFVFKFALSLLPPCACASPEYSTKRTKAPPFIDFCPSQRNFHHYGTMSLLLLADALASLLPVGGQDIVPRLPSKGALAFHSTRGKDTALLHSSELLLALPPVGARTRCHPGLGATPYSRHCFGRPICWG